MRAKRRTLMFSPIRPTSAVRTDSTVPPPIGSADSAATSAGSRLATRLASSRENARKSSFFATKSVSQLTSTIAPSLRSSDCQMPTTPSAVTRAAALLALLPSLTRRISSARPMSPSASASAFLHSIIGASVFSRSSFTMLAVISAIALLLDSPFEPSSGFLAIDLDELLVVGGRLDDLLQRGRAALEDRVGRAARVQADRLAGIVVARNHVVDALGRVVAVDHRDDRDAQLVRLGDRDLVEADVDDEDRVRQAAHFLDAPQALLQLLELALEHQRFLLRHPLDAALGDRRLHVLEPLDRGLDGLEVGQHAAKPALVDVRHAGAGRLFGDDLARLALRADEHHGAAVGRELAQVLHRVLVHDQGLLEIEDVDLVAVAVDVRGHPRVPEARLVAEMNAGLEHLPHGDGHDKLLSG